MHSFSNPEISRFLDIWHLHFFAALKDIYKFDGETVVVFVKRSLLCGRLKSISILPRKKKS